MNKQLNKMQLKKQRRARIRARVIGTATRPRLSVFRSLTGVYAQLVDDATGKTIIAIHSGEVKTGDAGERKGKTALAYLVGKALGEKAKAKGITAAVFDRGGNKYHGRVAAVADGARDSGLTL